MWQLARGSARPSARLGWGCLRALPPQQQPGQPCRSEFTWSGGKAFQKAPDVMPEADFTELARKWSVVDWNTAAVRRWADLEVRLKTAELDSLEKHGVDGMELLTVPTLQFKGTMQQMTWGLRWTAMKRIMQELTHLVQLNSQVELGSWLVRSDPTHRPLIMERRAFLEEILEDASFVWLAQDTLNTYEPDPQSPGSPPPTPFEGTSVLRWVFGPRGSGKTTLLSQLAREICSPEQGTQSRAPFVVDAAQYMRHLLKAKVPMSLGRWFQIQTGHHWRVLLLESQFPRDVFLDNVHALFFDDSSRYVLDGTVLQAAGDESMTLPVEIRDELFDFWSTVSALLYQTNSMMATMEGKVAPRVPSSTPPLLRVWMFAESRGMDPLIAPMSDRLRREDADQLSGERDPNNQVLFRQGSKLEAADLVRFFQRNMQLMDHSENSLAHQLADLVLQQTEGHVGLGTSMALEFLDLPELVQLQRKLDSAAQAAETSSVMKAVTRELASDDALLQRICVRGLLGELPKPPIRPDIFQHLKRFSREVWQFWIQVCWSQEMPSVEPTTVKYEGVLEETPAASHRPDKGLLCPPGPMRALADQLSSLGMAEWDRERAYMRPLPILKTLWKLRSSKLTQLAEKRKELAGEKRKELAGEKRKELAGEKRKEAKSQKPNKAKRGAGKSKPPQSKPASAEVPVAAAEVPVAESSAAEPVLIEKEAHSPASSNQ